MAYLGYIFSSMIDPAEHMPMVTSSQGACWGLVLKISRLWEC